MAKKSKEVQKRGMWEFPPRIPEDYTATARIIDKLKNPKEYRIGSSGITNSSAGGSVGNSDNGIMASIKTDKSTVGDT